MSGHSQGRMVLDAKKSWSNLPFALMPACVGVCLVAYPWMGGLDPAMTAPIMVPFGLVWLLIAICINGYHSELILDPEAQSVAYRSSLVLHSWSNQVHRDNVDRIVLRKDDNRYRFLLKVREGEDLTITTFDYWRSREWSERVAAFLQVPLEDQCRGQGELSPEALKQSFLDTYSKEEFSSDPPGKIGLERLGDKAYKLVIPPRGLLPSAKPRLALGAFALLGGAAAPFFLPSWGWALSVLSLVLVSWSWFRPLAQATHREELEVSPNGLLATTIVFGRSHKASFAVHDIREVTVLEGADARFEHDEFDRHAVCVEGPEGHVQLGSHLPKSQQVHWLQQALLRGLVGDMPKAE